MPKVLQSICEAIEDTHGRLTPNVYENNNYTKNRMRYLQDTINDRHFDEKMGSTFVNVIDRKAIQEAIKSKCCIHFYINYLRCVCDYVDCGTNFVCTQMVKVFH